MSICEYHMHWHVLRRYQQTTFCSEILDSLNHAVGTVEYAARHSANVAYARDPDALCWPVNGHQRHPCSFAESFESAEDLHFGSAMMKAGERQAKSRSQGFTLWYCRWEIEMAVIAVGAVVALDAGLKSRKLASAS